MAVDIFRGRGNLRRHHHADRDRRPVGDTRVLDHTKPSQISYAHVSHVHRGWGVPGSVRPMLKPRVLVLLLLLLSPRPPPPPPPPPPLKFTIFPPPESAVDSRRSTPATGLEKAVGTLKVVDRESGQSPAAYDGYLWLRAAYGRVGHFYLVAHLMEQIGNGPNNQTNTHTENEVCRRSHQDICVAFKQSMWEWSGCVPAFQYGVHCVGCGQPCDTPTLQPWHKPCRMCRQRLPLPEGWPSRDINASQSGWDAPTDFKQNTSAQTGVVEGQHTHQTNRQPKTYETGKLRMWRDSRTEESRGISREAAVLATASPLLCPAGHTLLPAFSSRQMRPRRLSLGPSGWSPKFSRPETKNEFIHMPRPASELSVGGRGEFRMVKNRSGRCVQCIITSVRWESLVPSGSSPLSQFWFTLMAVRNWRGRTEPLYIFLRCADVASAARVMYTS